MFDFIQKFKNTRLYWKYRHFIQKDTWSTYYNDFSKDRRNFYTYLYTHKQIIQLSIYLSISNY